MAMMIFSHAIGAIESFVYDPSVIGGRRRHLTSTKKTGSCICTTPTTVLYYGIEVNNNKEFGKKVTITDPEKMIVPPPARWNCPVLEYEDVCSQTGITLSRYMMEMSRINPELEEIESIFTSLQVACKTLANLVRTASLSGLTGLEAGGGSINVQGEEQKKLDVIANDVMKNALKWTGKLSTIASEEEDKPVNVGGGGSKTNGSSASSEDDDQNILLDNMGNPVFSSDIIVESSGRYTAVFDPLDGSSNIDAGIPVGTIFGIFEEAAECEIDFDSDTDEIEEQRCLRNTLQPGENLVAAGYCLYSSATTFVFTIGNGVVGFTYDERIGEFVLTHNDMTIPKRGKIYSFNEANRWDWDAPLQNYVTDIQQGLVGSLFFFGSRSFSPCFVVFFGRV